MKAHLILLRQRKYFVAKERKICMSTSAIIMTKKKDLILDVAMDGTDQIVQAICDYCRIHRYISPDDNWRDMIAVVSNVMQNRNCFVLPWSAPHVEGILFCIEDWRIVSCETARIQRMGTPHKFDSLAEWQDWMLWIDSHQPAGMQLGKDFIFAKETPVADIKVGDKVFVYDKVNHKFQLEKVAGIGKRFTQTDGGQATNPFETEDINGENIVGKPYCDKYKDGLPWETLSNYLLDETYRVV